MDDLSHMLTGVNGHAGMAPGLISPVPDFGAAGSEPQADAPETGVPDVTGAPVETYDSYDDYDDDGE